MNFNYTIRKLGHLLRKEAMKADTGRDSLASDHVKELHQALVLLSGPPENIRVKFLKGWLSIETMKEPGWLYAWIASATEAKEQNIDLVVFRIPKDETRPGLPTAKISNMVSHIEWLLQKRFPNTPDSKF